MIKSDLSSIDKIDEAVKKITLSLLEFFTDKISRKDFFKVLSSNLKKYFHYDRLCINLYDTDDNILSYFTNAEGTLINLHSPLRSAETTTTVAGQVISARRTLTITDFTKYFKTEESLPIEEAGLTSTIASPLFINNEIIGTIHCSFSAQPANINDIALLMTKLCKVITPCLSAIIGYELKRSLPNLTSQSAEVMETSLIYNSKAMKDIVRYIEGVANYTLPILILGETGTGKSRLAHYIHTRSNRKKGLFVKVNCPALSPSLFESELFGHAKGAFTGALTKRIGRFELAHMGTLFLDEIADLSVEMQSKLLQVIEDSRFERVGESTSLAVDVRLCSATNTTIGSAIQSGTLRSDLYHRLSSIIIEIPPLRERREDIHLYTKFFLQDAGCGKRLSSYFSKQHLRILEGYDWPGNLRELRNIVSRAIIMRDIHKELTVQDLQKMLDVTSSQFNHGIAQPQTSGGKISTGTSSPRSFTTKDQQTFNGLTDTSLQAQEKNYILHVLEKVRWKVGGKNGAAAILGIPRTTLIYKMKKLGIERDCFN